MMKRKKRKARLREKNRAARIVRISLFSIFFLSILVWLAVFSRTDNARISSISVTGTNLVSKGSLEQLSQSMVANSFLGIFRSDNIVLYPRGKTERKILENFKPIEKVEISFSSPNNLDIKVTEREPAFLWCRGGGESTTESCYFVDPSGYIFGQSPRFSGDLFLVLYGLIEGENPIGQSFLSGDKLRSLMDFIDGVKDLRGNPISLVAHSPEDFELSLRPSGKILFNTKSGLLNTLDNLRAIVDERSGVNRTDFWDRLDYIDMRFGFKAFLKLR